MKKSLVCLLFNIIALSNLYSFEVELSSDHFWEVKADAYCFLLSEDFTASNVLKAINTRYALPLELFFKHNNFSAKKGQSYTHTVVMNERVVQLIFVGLGREQDSWHENIEMLRQGAGSLVTILKKNNTPRAVLAMPQAQGYKVDSSEMYKQVALVSHLTNYALDDFKQGARKKYDGTLLLTGDGSDEDHLKWAIAFGSAIGRAMNVARRWCDLPANILTPTYMAQEAYQMAKFSGVKFSAFGRRQAQEMGMGGFCAVDSGAGNRGKCIILEHRASSPDAPTIVLVGKGVTFDTGGVSIKTAAGMRGMKYDMCGAASVIATLGLMGQLRPDITVIGIAPMVENMLDGKSYREDDIIQFMNGKTAEIANTDAEGRLILADALCYAEKHYNPDLIIDIATLTGSAWQTFDRFYTAMMTRFDSIAASLEAVGQFTGDRVWRLPLTNDYQASMSSSVADLVNAAKPGHTAGAITAGIFLESFVDHTPWVHLDIAGTAKFPRDCSYLSSTNATGAGIRLLTEYICALALKHIHQKDSKEKHAER